MVNCIICNKYFENEIKAGRPSKTCSGQCKHKLYINQIIEWNKNNKDKFNKIQERYKKLHPDRVRKAQIEWQNRNKDKTAEYNKKSLKQFIKNNPSYFNEHSKKNYEENKEKWSARSKTRYLIINGIIKLKGECRSCKIDKNLQIHHEIYPQTDEEIIKAVNESKIYNLCKNCHNFVHSLNLGY